MSGGVISRVRQPEYTGENRCLPCTAVNVALAALVSSAILVVVNVPVAVLVFSVGLVLIALRGYLVPGTPALTRRYFPESVLRVFGKAPDAADSSGWETLDRVETRRERSTDVEQLLGEMGAVERADDSGYQFTAEFETAVKRRLDDIRRAGSTPDGHPVPLDRETLAPLFDAEPEEISYKQRAYPAIKIGVRVRKWPGQASLFADVAAHQALAGRSDSWLELPYEQRLDALEALRSFHDRCPSCDGPLAETTETVQSCCLSMDVIALACENCGEQLLEREPSQASWQKLRGL